MLQKQKRITAVMLLLICTVVTGCSNQSKDAMKGDSPYYSVSIDGEHIGVLEDDERVEKLKALGNGFIDAVITKDYKNPNVMREFDYYSKDLYDSYMSSGRADSLMTSLMNYEYVVTVNQIDVNEIQFYKSHGQVAASVSCVYISTIEHAIADYFQLSGLEQNAKYSRSIMIEFVLEEDEWKISSFSYGTREKVNG